MKITGIICEYNPLHNGHRKQMQQIRQLQGEDTAIVCLMSGNYVQRGTPAVFHKSCRAAAAIDCGADLVLELPVTASLSSAEGFAQQGVSILSGWCSHLCFGAEDADPQKHLSIAQALLSSKLQQALRPHLDAGLSFPAARQKALEDMGVNADLLTSPNNILAVEYCKAILQQNSDLQPLVIHREGDYHATCASKTDPSATFVRQLILNQENWVEFIPKNAQKHFRDSAVHDLSFGEKAVLSQLRRMTEEEFMQLPHGSEGLWRKLMHAARECNDLWQILAVVKSKRYTQTRIQRMILCAYLGITEQMLKQPAPYVRVLGFSSKGRQVLKLAREHGQFPNIGQVMEDPYQQLEQRWGDLYELFSQDLSKSAVSEEKLRIYYNEA